MYIDRYIKSVQAVQSKIVSHQPPPVPVLMDQQANSEPETNKLDPRQETEKDLQLLVTLTKCESKFITVS